MHIKAWDCRILSLILLFFGGYDQYQMLSIIRFFGFSSLANFIRVDKIVPKKNEHIFPCAIKRKIVKLKPDAFSAVKCWLLRPS